MAVDVTICVHMQGSIGASIWPAAWKESCERNLREGNHTMSAAIKDATSCCSEEADPSAARVSVQEILCTGAQVWMCMCMHMHSNAHDSVCVYICVWVCEPCKMIPSVNGQFLMCTMIPDFAISGGGGCRLSRTSSDGHISRLLLHSPDGQQLHQDSYYKGVNAGQCRRRCSPLNPSTDRITVG